MGKVVYLLPKKIAGKPYTPWQVSVPKSLTGTRRVRKFFASEGEAELFIVRLRMEGFAQATSDRSEVKDQGIRVAEAVSMFLARTAGGSKATSRQLNYVMKNFVARFGTKPVAVVDHKMLDMWLRDLPMGETTVWNHYRVTRRFFSYCHDFLEVMDRNPFRKVPKPVSKPEGGNTAVLSPEDMRRCLKVAWGFASPGRERLLAFLCLGGFAGLRTEEIFHVEWEDVNLKGGELFVRQPKRVRGWRPRYVHLAPIAVKLLSSIRGKGQDSKGSAGSGERVGGRFTLNTRKLLPGGQRELYTHRRALMDVLKWEKWPPNCLRHSFGTYHLAEHRDLAKLRTEMGHESEDVTRAHYALAAKKADGKKWWSERLMFPERK